MRKHNDTSRTMISNVVFRSFILIASAALVSCQSEEEAITLPGKIVVMNLMQKECSIYLNSDQRQSYFKFTDEDYSGVKWLNTRDAFIGTESIPGKSKEEERCNIVEFDMSGKMTDVIYESAKGELAWPEYFSRDDRYLLFNSRMTWDPYVYPFEGLAPMVSLRVMDLQTKKIVARTDSIGRSPNFWIAESPWLSTGYRFVYSIDGSTKLKLKGEEGLINPVQTAEGVYIYDLISNERKLLVPGGHDAIASAIGNQIAYEKENSIRVFDVDTREEKIIYEHSSNEKIRGMHWTPDGKYIYFAYRHNYWIVYFTTGEKLIDVTTLEEKPFKKISLGFNSFSWK